MKKLMVLAAMLAMMLAMAAPAFAQTIAVDEGDDVEYNAGAQNLIGSVGDITNTQSGTAVAAADNDSAAAAEVAQTQEVSISQTNEFGNGLYFWGWWWF